MESTSPGGLSLDLDRFGYLQYWNLDAERRHGLADDTAHAFLGIGRPYANSHQPACLPAWYPRRGARGLFDRRKLLLMIESYLLIVAFVLGLLTLWGYVSAWTLLLLAFLMGIEPAFLFKTKDHVRKDGWSKFLAVPYANPYLRSLAKNERLRPS